MKKIILIFILLSSFVYANIAKVTTLVGEVNIHRADKTLKASKGFEILEKDTIKTTAEGRVQLLFTDNTIISVGYNSTFSIDEYVNDANKPPKASFGLKKGIFKSITGKIGNLNPDRFKLKTKSASIGIRGTTILANIGDTEEKIICTDGGIRVENENGFTDVDAGEMTTVKNGGAPSQAVFATSDDIGELEDQSGASQNEAESGINQESANEAKRSNGNANQNNNQNAAIANNQNTNANTNTQTPTTGFENDLAGNSNISQSVFYKTTLTNNYNQSTDKFSSKQRLIVKSGTDNALSTTDGSIGNYLSWGHWGVTSDTSESKSDFSGSTYEGRSYWLSGALTPASDVPTSGSATYTGSIAGSVIRSAGTSLAGNTVSGSTSITADFGSNSMSGTFNVDGFANTNLSNVNMTREQYGVTFSGDLSGTNVTSGLIDGAFYGDNAQAVGGTWQIEDTSQNAANGTFAAEK